MSYLTFEVQIDHGRIVPREPEKLPASGTGLLTILPKDGGSAASQDTLFPRAAGLHPTPRREPRPTGLAKGEFAVPDEFNAPLPPEVLKAFEGQ